MSSAHPVAWRPGPADAGPLLAIVLLLLVAALPQLAWLQADPLLYTANIPAHIERGVLRGVPYIDPNNGFQTQALGVRAALDWLSGSVPWWNPYTGVGLPLAAEYQPGAFFPLTFLLLLPKGTVWLQLALQVLSGIGTYGVLRHTGCGRFAATTGALLYAFNGTLAWFAHGPASAVPFLPWMIWGIERAYAASLAAGGSGWRLLAGAMALSLLSAFPETAYVGGLLALGWSIVRGLQLPHAARWSYAGRIALGGVVGIAIALPQIHAFLHYLPLAFLGGHGGEFAHAALAREAFIPSFIAPYVFGPIFATAHWPVIPTVWGSLGGYATIALTLAAVYGAAARRGALAWLLVGWCLLVLAKSFGIEPAKSLLNLVPGVAAAAFARYVQPSWELAFVILAAWGLEDLRRNGVRTSAWMWAFVVVAGLLVVGYLEGARMWPRIEGHVGLRNAALGSAAWAALTALLALLFFKRARGGRALAALLIADALVMHTIPTLSNPRAGAVDTAAIDFLRRNLGLQRLYTLGPLQPNYGAYFGIASINHNYLPVAKRWIDWVHERLDAHADPVAWVGNYPRPLGTPTQAQELRRNLANYEAVGVRYVISHRNHDSLDGVPGVRQVYQDNAYTIHELASPRPYFESLHGGCKVDATDRLRAVARCERPDVLVRRELHFPGWEARVRDVRVEIAEHDRLFQSITLPAGESEVRFRYAPPHVSWAWWAALVAILAFAAPGVRRWRLRAHQ